MNGWILIGAAVFLVLLILSRSQASPPAVTSPEDRARLEQELHLCLASGRKIDAIKLYRRLHGTDLKSSKAAVESLLLGGIP